MLQGKHTVVATRTSSGKSMIFTLPALNALCESPDATALFLYPQKALANDQLNKIREQVAQLPSLRQRQSSKPSLVSRYDGSVASEDRKQIRDEVQVLLTNPDMLHLGILQHHQNAWARFFANLKLVAIDECHEYRGIFGTNVAYLMRRLRQVCELHGSQPTFVATSATIADPQQHMRELCGLDFELVGPNHDGSLQGRRKFWVVNGTAHHYDIGRKLATELAAEGLNVLAFCPSRMAAERMLSKLRDGSGQLPEEVAVYRSGLTAQERETIETDFRSGRKKLVFSTSALELGVDIGGLDVVICIGLPSSMMSLWQRAGRVARGGREGAIILIPGDSPLETYYAKRPDELFSRQHETLALNLSNQRVSCQHYACAVAENGRGEAGLMLEVLGEQIQRIQELRDAGELDRPEFYDSDPHAEVGLRNTGETNYQIVYGQETVGDIGSFHLLREAPRNALYRHNGKVYRVKDVIRGKKLVRVVPEWTRHETTSYVQKSIRQKAAKRVRKYSELTVAVAKLNVTEYLKAVTEKDASGKSVRSYPPSGMPNHFLPTEGLSVALSNSLERQLTSLLDIKFENAVASVERLAAALFPTVTGPCDSQDYSSGIDRNQNGELAIYLYDNVYDGVNLTELAFDRLEPLLQRVRERIASCDCLEDAGCIRCVADTMRETPASKLAAVTVVDSLLGVFRSESPAVVELGEPDIETTQDTTCGQCKAKVSLTARFCSNCGSPQQTNAS